MRSKSLLIFLFACHRCNRSCENKTRAEVCGTDGVTYRNRCELRKAKCQLGKEINVTYSGPCKCFLSMHYANLLGSMIMHCTEIACKVLVYCITILAQHISGDPVNTPDTGFPILCTNLLVKWLGSMIVHYTDFVLSFPPRIAGITLPPPPGKQRYILFFLRNLLQGVSCYIKLSKIGLGACNIASNSF